MSTVKRYSYISTPGLDSERGNSWYVEGEFSHDQLIKEACIIEDCIAESDLPEQDDGLVVRVCESLPEHLWRHIYDPSENEP